MSFLSKIFGKKCSNCGKKLQANDDKVVPQRWSKQAGKCAECGQLFCGSCFVFPGVPSVPNCPKCGGKIKPA